MKSKRFSVFTGLLLLFFGSVWAQKAKTDPDHSIWYTDVNTSTNELDIEVKDGVSKVEYSKFKIKLHNKTNDYIVYKPSESTFQIDGKDFHPSDKLILIEPMGKGGRVPDIKGNGQNVHVDQYQFLLNGLYKIKADAPAVDVPNFKLPASVNEVTAGNFKIEMMKIKKETKETVVKFKITYIGKGYGLVNPNKLGVKIENGQEFANSKHQDPFLLASGESDGLDAVFIIPGKIADMQFANMEILWRDTFKESQLEALPSITIDMKIDEGKTAGKNK